MSAPFRYDRRFEFEVTRGDLWSLLTRIQEYPRWWPWLDRVDGDALAPGAVAHCAVRAPAPLPYTLRFAVAVDRVVAHERVEASVTGDLEGPAVLEIADGHGMSSARLTFTLDLRDRVLRRLSVVARPAMVWAHDRVIDHGLRAFEGHALDGHGDGA